ncbi:hypothetical protein HYC85_028617 [Camellia sinensis]|uniref:3-beta hydroxysteroid dehydrogenase/isomerase domain-containing protein n=1 Tax=Camellia sinensis TaxID=4442 RepID=A0A7J7FZN0_CAMSI|nr:hypothetical protein HYC85_028617 [Camellia sinensis]
MVEPTVNETKNVIIATAKANVWRMVFTSSIGAVTMDPNRGPNTVVDESSWSDLEFFKNTKVYYCVSRFLTTLPNRYSAGEHRQNRLPERPVTEKKRFRRWFVHPGAL